MTVLEVEEPLEVPFDPPGGSDLDAKGSPCKLSNPRSARQLSPAIHVLERRSSEREFELATSMRELSLRQDGSARELSLRSEPSAGKLERFQHGVVAVGEAGGLTKWNYFYSEERLKGASQGASQESLGESLGVLLGASLGASQRASQGASQECLGESLGAHG